MTSDPSFGSPSAPANGPHQTWHRWSTAVAAVDRMFASIGPTPCLVVEVARQARLAASCDLTWLASGSGSEDLMVQAVSTSPHVSRSRAENALTSGASATLTDATLDVVRTGQSARVGDLGLTDALDTEMGPAILVPISVSGRRVGVLGLAWIDEHAHRCETADPASASVFCTRAGWAVLLADFQSTAARRARSDERDRMAEDLHDRVCQRLYATSTRLASVRRSADAGTLLRLTQGVAEQIDETIQDVRRVMVGAPLVDRRCDLYEDLRTLAEHASAGSWYELEVAVTNPHRLELAAEVRTDLMLAAEEALSNVSRHADAGWCRVAVEIGETITLVVEDDGLGVLNASVGQGTVNLARRAARHGGTSAIRPRSPGTRVVWSVPRPT